MATKQVVAAQPFDISKYQTKGATSEMEVSINGDKFTITIRQLPWFEKSDITTKCMTFDTKTGVTSVTDEFLNSIDGSLGTALEQLVPNAFTNEMTEVEVIKKES